MVGTGELVFFAIQATVRLARTGRKLFVENTASREIILPLPAGFTSLPATAREYAEQMARNPKTKRRFEETFRQPFQQSIDGQGPERRHAEQELIQLYLLDLQHGRVAGSKADECELAGIAALKQWGAGESPFPHPLQRVAGVLVEVSIDYFLHVPGALRAESRQGKALKSLLLGLDQFDFQEARWDGIVVGLFTAGLDTLATQGEALGGDLSGELVRQLASGVAADLQTRLQHLGSLGDLDAEERLQRFGQIVLRSLLRNGGRAALHHPALLSADHNGGGVIIQEVGSTFLDLLLDEETGSLGDNLRQLASTQTLDRLIGASLKALAEHPQYFQTGTQPLDQWLRNLLTALHGHHQGGRRFIDSEIFGEVACLAVEHGLRDLPALIDQPTGHHFLLIAVARSVFETVTEDGPDGAPRWKVELSRSDVYETFASVLGAVAEHPEWVLQDESHQAKAKMILPVVLEALMQLGDGPAKALIRSGKLKVVLAAVLVSGLGEKLESVKAQQIAAALDLLLKELLKGGRTGLGSLFEGARLTDLLAALAMSKAADKFFGSNQAQRQQAVKNLIAVIEKLRTGQILAIPAMVRLLNKTA